LKNTRIARRQKLAKPQLVMTLAKVIIAAAWADGEVSHEEINSLKDLLFRLPNMEARDWASLEIYIDSPVGSEERLRLTSDLALAMSSRADKDLALSALDDLIHADGEIPESEELVAKEIRQAIEDADVGVIGGIGKLVKGSIQRRSEAVAGAPNREAYLEDFIKNRVYYGVRRRLDESDAHPDLSDADLRKLSLAGGLMARIAHIDREVTEGEIGAMEKALQDRWNCTKEQAALVAEVAVSSVAEDMDFYRMAREFFTCTTEEERVQFLDVLFAVADGDGLVSTPETEGIRRISMNLKMTHRQFIDAKLKIPRDRRTG
jgi:uncharacterized tellurite resistance protein B-like protein